ncbi:MAG: hypothetical protein ACFB9N_06530 [Geitlerinemataceae cyanobacterium]
MLRPSALRAAIVACCLSVTLTLTSCAQAPAPTAAPPAPTETSPTISTPSEVQPTDAVADEALPGATFNAFFPEAQDGLDRVYTQEKAGFAEVKLKRDGQEVAKLAISDTVSTPAAAQKFADATETIAGYPAVTVGKKQTAILVGGRFQVKAISVAEDFTPENRSTWLEKFDLNGLSQLP